MLQQLACNNIFLQFLRYIRVLALTGNNDALNISADVLDKHVVNLH